MARIRELPQIVVDQIAAGEVVERPASVVKELVENSLDAGARSVTVAIESGGMKSILVSDDGNGIHPDDFVLALTSHATSKIREAHDLQLVASLGFRGEALSSVAAVSRLAISSKTKKSPGHKILCEGGKIQPVRPCGTTKGTRIQVSDLFFNIPARRKFLKSARAESQAVTRELQKLALARWDVRFLLQHDGREVLSLPPADSCRRRVADLFGSSVVDALISVEASRGELELSGLVAPAAKGRGNSAYQFFFLNQRPVRDRTFLAAAREAYSGLMVGRRYPVVFLYLSMDPQRVDVNVHPCKTEVRFLDSSEVFSLLVRAIRERIVAEPATLPLKPDRSWDAGDAAGASHLTVNDTRPPPPGAKAAWLPLRAPVPPADEPPAPVEAELTAEESPPRTEAPREALQIHNTYLVAETRRGLAIYDQHALHEKILFIRLCQQIGESRLQRQKLLVPEIIELTPADVALVEDNRETLAEAGFEVDAFSERSLAIRSIPALLQKKPAAALFLAAFDSLSDLRPGKNSLRREVVERLLASIACKAAVKAGDRLDAEEISALLGQASVTEDVKTCPHGRPTVLSFATEELERQFQRKL